MSAHGAIGPPLACRRPGVLRAVYLGLVPSCWRLIDIPVGDALRFRDQVWVARFLPASWVTCRRKSSRQNKFLDQALPRLWPEHSRKTVLSLGRKGEPLKRPRLVSLFSGCGGLDLGFAQAGYNLVWANDINDDACETYARNLGDHVVVGDICEIDLSSVPQADIVVGGFPCQDFSMIWKRGGISTDRGNLYRNLVELVELQTPRVFVAENVKGLLTANRGGAVLQIKNDFAELGYEVDVDLYNFADYGVAQLRERVLLVGVRKDVQWQYVRPPATHERDNYISSREALRGVEKVPHNNERQRLAAKTIALLKEIPPGGNFSDIPPDHPLYVRGMISHVYRRLHPDEPSKTLIAAGGGGTWGYHFSEPRSLTNRERARLFGYPDDFEFLGTPTEVRRQIGNSVPPPAARVIADALRPAFSAPLKSSRTKAKSAQ